MARICFLFVVCSLIHLEVAANDVPVRVEQRENKISLRGEQVKTFSLSNDKLNLSISTLGASITALYVPDINGKYSDVVLGFSDHEKEAQTSGSPYFGCIVGRVANRIAEGKFTLDGKEYVLARNNGPNHLHGGEDGFDKRVWSVSQILPDGIQLKLHSPDGDQVCPYRTIHELNSIITLYFILSHTSADTSSRRRERYCRLRECPILCRLSHHVFTIPPNILTCPRTPRSKKQACLLA